MRGTYTTYYMRLIILGGYKFWAVTIILHQKILRLQFLGGYYYATVTITGITVQREEANWTDLLHFPWSCIVYADGTLGMKMSAIVSSSQ